MAFLAKSKTLIVLISLPASITDASKSHIFMAYIDAQTTNQTTLRVAKIPKNKTQ